MSSELVNDLRQQIANRQVVAIVGAGVSIGATNNDTVASWVGLLQDGVERCVQVVPTLDTKWPDRVRAEIDSTDVDDLLSAAEKIETKLRPQGGEFSRWLRQTVGALKPENRDVIRALKELGVPIATTNYDSLIEDVTGLPPVTWRESARVELLIRGTELGVLHLHGHWRDPESVVLGIRSYERILGDAHAQAIQQALRATRTLLFVGYGAGLADPNFGALLRWSRHVFSGSEYRHFRLALEQDVKATQAMHPAEERIYVLSFGDKLDDLASYLRSLREQSRPRGDSERRKEYREKVRRALSDQLDQLFDDQRKNPRDLALALTIKAIPDKAAKVREAILDHLLDHDDSVPLLHGLINEWAKKKERDALDILENCLDLILPFHFAPEVVATASSCLNAKGGGFLKGVVMTKCGAELMMAALDQFESRFDPKDPELGGKHAIGRSLPPLGKITIDDDAQRFLAHILETESAESRARRLKWDRLGNKRTTYCIVRLPQESAEQDYALKLLERASEIQPELPILLLTTESQAKNPEEEYLRVLRRRFEDPRR
ncbi:MAG: SIR2 family protein [Isosphaeraceae bacterium]|nr:SIR2 family protein [Isosphaeraceae bacterium]